MPETIAILGAGTMGNGIAHVFARAGHPVLLADISQSALDNAVTNIGKNLAREVSKQKLTAAEAQAAEARITTTTSLDDLASASLAVEAATERFEVKSELFRTLDRVLPPEAILASNTSSISITRLAALTQRPGQVIGMHFFNPVPVMKLVEIIRGLQSTQASYDRVHALSLALGKIPVEVNDAAGFVSNRVLMPLINEACVCGDGGRRDGGGGGYDLSRRHGAPHGAADAGGLYRAGCVRGHYAGAGGRAWATPSTVLARCWCGWWIRGLAGAEVRARGFYTVLSFGPCFRLSLQGRVSDAAHGNLQTEN